MERSEFTELMGVMSKPDSELTPDQLVARRKRQLKNRARTLLMSKILAFQSARQRVTPEMLKRVCDL
ncbi:MAG: hypothetical protein RSD49_01670 [Hafnia sp.]